MKSTEQIEKLASQIIHNKEVCDCLRLILSEKFNKGEKDSTTYKLLSKQFDRAENNLYRMRHDLGELNARLTPDGVLEIY